MALYSLIQFSSVLILYTVSSCGADCSFLLHLCCLKRPFSSETCDLSTCVQVKTDLGDLQFLFCDIVLVTLLAIVMGKGGPSKELHHCRPPASLLALPVLGSLFIHACMNILGQLAALFITMSQDWSVQRQKAFSN